MKKISLICVFLFSIISVSHAQCNFTINNTPCAQIPVTFTVQSPGTGLYTWNFGDPSSGANNTASGLSTVHTFNTPGTYTVVLSENNISCPPQTVTIGGANPLLQIRTSTNTITPTTNAQGIPIYSICGNANATVYIRNISTLSTANTVYNINWGDGTLQNSILFPVNGPLLSHTYSGYGFYDIVLTAIENGCTTSKSYRFYSGSNPYIGIAAGNTTGLCAPSSRNFIITTTNPSGNIPNPSGTLYEISVDGVVVQTILQNATTPAPTSYTHNFTTSSCGLTATVSNIIYPNSSIVSITASNPCGSTSSSVAPVTVSTQPSPAFTYTPTSTLCPNSTVTFTDQTSNVNEVSGISPNFTCNNDLLPDWDISPLTGWTVASGSLYSSNTVGVTFLQPGTYTMTMTLPQTACQTQPVVQTITIQTPPTALASFTTNPTTNCVPAVVTLNNTSTGTTPVTYTWSVPPGVGASLPPNSTTFSTTTTSTAPITANFTQAGTYNITLTASNVCATATWTQPVTLKTRPTVTLTPINNICGVPTTISPSATYSNGGGTISSYNWNFTGGNPSSSTLQNPSPVTYTSSGIYTISATATNECGSTTATQSFTVIPIPSITLNTSVTPTICAGSSITISASAIGGTGLTYAWSNNAGSGASITVSPPSTTTYTVTVTNSAGCSATASQTVIVNPLPLATATNTGPYCLNNTISLNSNGGGTYSWSGPNGFTSSLQNPTISNATAINSGVYIVAVTLAGCTATASTSVTVNSNPVASITGNTPCVGGTLTLTPSGGTTYSWTGPNGFTSTANPLVLNGVTAANAGVYNVTASNASGCTATGSTTVIINALPIPVATNTGPVCPNNSATLNGSGGGTYSWTGPNGFTSTAQNPSVTPGTTNATYSLTVTNSNSCTASISTTITVRTPPNAVAINTSPRCLGSTSAIVLNASGGTTYSWSGPNSYTSSTQNPSLTTPVASNQGGVYTVTVTDANNCTATSQTTVVVNPLPIVGAGSTQLICNTYTGTTTFVGSPAGGTWTGTGITAAGVFTIPSNTVTSYPLTYTYTDNNGCTNTAVTQANVISNQAADAGADIAICNNATPLTLVGTPVGGTWSGNGVNGNTFNPIGLNAGNYTITYTVGSSNCQTTDTRVVTVLPLPTATISAPAVCQNQTLTLNASGSNISTYSWSGPPSFTNNTATIIRPNATVAMSGTYTLTITGTNSCTNTTSVIATVNPLPTVEAGLPQSICSSNSTYQLLGYSPTTGGTGVWTGTGVNAAGGFDASLAVGNYNLTYTFTDNNGCINSDVMVMTITANQAANAGVDESICNNALPLALVGTPVGGTWSGNGVTGASFSPIGLTPGTYTLTYTVNAGTVCQTVDTKIITVLPLPQITVSSTGPYCVGGSFALSAVAANAQSYAWGGPNSFNAAISNPVLNNLTTTMSGIYTVTVTGTNTCSATSNTSITVNALPIVNARDSSYCLTSGLVSLPYASPIGGTWTGTAVQSNQFNPSVAGLGTFVLVYTYTNPTTQCINADNSSISVVSPQTVNAGLDLSVCNNDPVVNLQPLGTPSGGTWSINSAGQAGLTGTNFTPSLLAPNNYTLTYTVGNGNCQVSDNMIITIRPLPSITATGSTVCANQVIQLAVAGTGLSAYSWSGPLGFNSTLQSPTRPNATTAMAGNYIVTVTGTNACQQTANATVIVNPLPIVDAGVNQTICNNNAVFTLSAFSPTSGGVGTWTGLGIVPPSGFSASLAGGVGNYTLTYTFTDLNACVNQDTISMTVTANNPPNAGAAQSVCLNTPAFSLVNGSPVGGTWSGSGIAIGSNVFNPLTAGVGQHILTYSIGQGICLTTDTVIYTVRPLPNAIATSVGPYCVTGAFTLQASGGISYVWSGPMSFTSTLSSPVISNLTLTNSGIYTVTVTGANACSQTATTSITINPLPIILSSDTTYCNTPGLVPLPYTSPANGSWAGSGISGLSFNPQIGVGTYNATYTYTDNNSCTDSVTVEISVIDPVSINAGPNDTVCIDAGLFTLTNYSPSSGGNWSGAGIINSSNGIFNPLLAGGGLHILTYTYGTGNCQVTASKTIFVVDLSATTAGVDEAFCISRPIFNLTGNNPLGGIWSGDGITDVNLGTYDPMIAGAGLDTLSYTYTDVVSGCQWTDYKIINVYPLPTPDFDSLGAICINVPYTFNNNSPNITSSLWTFGDGGTSNLTSPTHTYNSIGYYTVSLIASNIYGCVDSVSRTIFVTEPPYAHFTMDTTEGCEPLPIVFTNQSYGYGASYLWDFGNGTVDTNYTPAPVIFSAWAQDTVYHITLTVSNLCGTVVWEDSVLVHPIPLVRFSPNIDDGCSPLFVSFTNTTRGNPDTYFWDMGNGFTTTDSIPPIQYYNTDTLPRIYTVTLISGNECGFDTLRHDIVVNPVTVDAFFYADTTSGCEPLTVNFSNYSTPNTSIVWDFGDNNGSSLASPVHVFDSSGIFKVIQYVSNGCGYDSAFVYITVYPQPAVEFTHPAYVCAGLPMQFTNTSSSVIISSWDFGDGTTSSDQNPSHIYANGGVYTVTLIGTSLGNGCPAQISHNVLIRSNPVPIFTPSSTFGCPPLNITFNNTSQGGLFYTWDFGDGNTAITASPSHLYTVSGQYTVALEVTDNFGCKADTAMYNLFVYPIPSSSFTYTPVSLCGIPTTINFTNTSAGAIGYNWTFGNGANSILNNPTAIYTSADDFNVSLVATNQYLCSDTANAVITTYAQPQADFLLTPDNGCQPLVVSFSDNSIDANGWEWVFGDGNSSNLPNPVHTYVDEGTYNVTLIANYSNTCFDTILVSNAVEVLPTPVADFSYVEVLEPASGIINFTNESSPDANQFEWDFGDGDFSNEENPNHRYYINGNRAIMLTVMAENGCQDTIVKQITPTIFRGLFVPNAFSPEVGVGDVRLFWPKGVGLAYYHVKVYSPWGELLWQSDKLNEGIPSESWDGTYHGALMPQDVYVWECDAIFIDGSNWKGMPDKDGVYRKIGSVTLLR